jgi:hypothetical protein
VKEFGVGLIDQLDLHMPEAEDWGGRRELRKTLCVRLVYLSSVLIFVG